MMMKILFVCHGNICRSTMAEFVLKDMAQKKGLDWEINSAGTSTEELGNDIHRGTKAKLTEKGISFTSRSARQITKRDYEHYDLLIGMDRYNMINMRRFYGGDPQGKLRLLLDYTSRGGDIADPWYTGDFDEVYTDIHEGCEALIKKVLEH
jgi:protein-tyrosine phosphatase